MASVPHKEIIPLYSRVATIIQHKILSGQYEAGERLPTEEELVQYFGASKITIRSALSILQANGLITRNPGKGTYVADTIPDIPQSVYTNLIGLVPLMDSRITPLEISKIHVRQSRIPRDICSFFKINGTDEIGRIKRLVERKSVLYFIEYYLMPDMLKQITEKKLKEKKSIQAILQASVDVRYAKGEMYLQAITAEPDISKLLRCQTFDPLIYTQTYFWTEGDKPFSIANRYFRASHFKYKINIDLSKRAE